jgi:hypothetical protein
MDATQLEKAQKSLKARMSSPAGRSESVRSVKGMKQFARRTLLALMMHTALASGQDNSTPYQRCRQEIKRAS